MNYCVKLINPITRNLLIVGTPYDLPVGIRPGFSLQEACMDIPLTYTSTFDRIFDGGIRCLAGISGRLSIYMLSDAMSSLEDYEDPYGLNPARPSVRRILSGLMFLAIVQPDGIWSIN